MQCSTENCEQPDTFLRQYSTSNIQVRSCPLSSFHILIVILSHTEVLFNHLKSLFCQTNNIVYKLTTLSTKLNLTINFSPQKCGTQSASIMSIVRAACNPKTTIPRPSPSQICFVMVTEGTTKCFSTLVAIQTTIQIKSENPNYSPSSPNHFVRACTVNMHSPFGLPEI